MGADITRDTFHPAKHFLRVLSQQGRVTVDADPNEQTSILLHYLEALMQDVVGPYGGPSAQTGFTISYDPVSNAVTIGPGRYYVNGILCENEQELSYQDQDGFANVPAPNLTANDYFYLDVWERPITSVQDDEIRESALGGPDTCARSKVVWQVWLGRDDTNPDKSCQALGTWLKTLPTLSDAQLKVQVAPQDDGDVDPCSISPASRYRGLENQLYRLEIHRGGTAWGGVTDPATAATFKWSRDNGSVVFPIVSENGSVVTVESLGRDATMSLEVDDWVEIVDDDIELVGVQASILSGILAQVDAVDPVGLTVTLRAPADVANISWPTYDDTSTNHPFLRRWDQKEMDGLTFSGGAMVITESSDPSTWIPIEDGIEVQFQPHATPNPQAYKRGDYWLIPARVATGQIEWPSDLTGVKSLPPFGIVHAYAPLATIVQGAPITLKDCRCGFDPLCNPKSGLG